MPSPRGAWTKLTITPTQLARLNEYLEVTIHSGAGKYVRVKVRPYPPTKPLRPVP